MNPTRCRDARILVGVSSCLLGEAVRYDGGHKRDRSVMDVLGKRFQFVAVCPEVAIGLGVPRPPLRLEGDARAPRAVGVGDPGLDVTDALIRYGRKMARELPPISGYIFKARSPSCGMRKDKVYRPGQPAAEVGVGLYAREIMRARPTLPVEDEVRLNDPGLRRNFITRVLVYRRWQELEAAGLIAKV